MLWKQQIAIRLAVWLHFVATFFSSLALRVMQWACIHTWTYGIEVGPPVQHVRRCTECHARELLSPEEFVRRNG